MANSSRTTMGILDVKIATRLGIKTSIVKVAYHENDLFCSTILKALKKYLKSDDEDYDDAAAEIALGRINTIGCNKVREHCNLIEWLEDDDVTLCDLDSTSTPILKSGLDIILEPKTGERKSLTAPRRKKQVGSVADVLMKKTLLPVSYLECEVEVDGKLNLQQQLRVGLVQVMKDVFHLGYCDEKQRGQLRNNLGHINNVLCFVQKYWKVLVRKEFPELPKPLQSSPLMDLLSNMKRELRENKK